MIPHHQRWASDSMNRLLILAALVISLGQSAAATESGERLQRLREVMTERLVIMEQVARYKWNAGLPVEDPDREAAILKKTLAIAVGGGLNPEFATRVVRAQIEAAKIVQNALFEQWRIAGAGKFAEVPSLTAILRPEVTRLSNELIAALIAAQDDLDDCLARRILSPVPGVLARFPGAWRAAIDGTLGATGPCPSPADGP